MKLGIQALANSMLVIPKTLAVNSGFDQQDTMLKLQDEINKNTNDPENVLVTNSKGAKSRKKDQKMKAVGFCVTTGGTMDPTEEGIWDNYNVKKQTIYLATSIACQ